MHVHRHAQAAPRGLAPEKNSLVPHQTGRPAQLQCHVQCHDGHCKLTMLCKLTWYFILLKLKLKCLLMLYVRIMHPGTLYVRYQGVFGNAASTMSCICPGGKWLSRYVRGVGNGMALCTLYGDRYALRESYGRLVSLPCVVIDHEW